MSVVATVSTAGWSDCRLCGSRLILGRERVGRTDDLTRGVCAECQGRPEAARFGKPSGVPAPASRPAAPKAPRAFTVAERSLIAKLHAHMPAAQLLDILNSRLVADVGAAAVPFTLQQLQAEVEQLVEASATEGDWGSLRKVLARARRSGLLASITPQMVDDFGVVFQLSPAQHVRLKDVIRNAQEER